MSHNIADSEDTQTQQFGIPLPEFINLFKLNDPQFYRLNDDIKNKDQVLEILLGSLKAMPSRYAVDLQARTNQIQSMSVCAAEDGSFICHVAYPSSRSTEETPMTRSILFMGIMRSSVPNGPFDRASAYFVSEGFSTKPDDFDQDVFFPLQAFCRLRQEGDKIDSVALIETGAEMVLALNYAREALELIQTNTPLSTEALQDWLSDDMMDTATARYVGIRQETAADFRAHLQMRVAEKNIAPDSFMMPTPTMWQ